MNGLQIIQFQNLEVQADFNAEDIWLTEQQIAELYQTERSVVNKHINNIYKGEELASESTCAFFARTDIHGREIKTKHYNLDMIFSVGYRVNSKKAIIIRKEATKLFKKSMKGLVLPDFSDPVEAARAWADECEQKQQALADKKQLEKENKQLKPLAHIYQEFMDSDGNFTFESAAKILKTGQNRLFALLRDNKYFYKREGRNTPYQDKSDAGYFIVKAKTYLKGDKCVS